MSNVHLQMTDALASYLRAASPEEPAYLAKLREETASHPRAIMQITPEQGLFMGLLARMAGARKALEIGVFTGYSSIAVALALPQDGKLIACDVSEEYTSVARRYWKEADLESKIDLRIAPAMDTLNGLLQADEAGSFDMSFIDADKGNYRNYYEASLKLVRSGGIIVLDNMLWHGQVADPKDIEPDTVAIRDLTALIRSDGRVWSCLLPIGDGVTLALKK